MNSLDIGKRRLHQRNNLDLVGQLYLQRVTFTGFDGHHRAVNLLDRAPHTHRLVLCRCRSGSQQQSACRANHRQSFHTHSP